MSLPLASPSIPSIRIVVGRHSFNESAVTWIPDFVSGLFAFLLIAVPAHEIVLFWNSSILGCGAIWHSICYLMDHFKRFGIQRLWFSPILCNEKYFSWNRMLKKVTMKKLSKSTGGCDDNKFNNTIIQLNEEESNSYMDGDLFAMAHTLNMLAYD